jgi:two-component system, LytTR family, response regulator
MSSEPVLRVFVTDDEAPARRKVIRFLEQEAQVVLVGEAGSGAATVAAIPQAKPDLLLLDIQMPEMDGFDVLAALENIFLPKTVFVTAHDEYALRALESHAFDYLLKPFDQARFSKAIADVRRQTAREQHGESKIALQRLLEQVRAQREPRLLVEENGRGTLLSLHQVDWVQADRNYLKLHTAGHTYHVRGTIESIEERVDSSGIFLRLNRSALVRIDFIHELRKWTHGEYQVILQSGQQLMWTRRYLARHSELLCRL